MIVAIISPSFLLIIDHSTYCFKTELLLLTVITRLEFIAYAKYSMVRKSHLIIILLRRYVFLQFFSDSAHWGSFFFFFLFFFYNITFYSIRVRKNTKHQFVYVEAMSAEVAT